MIRIRRFNKHKEPQSIDVDYPISSGLNLLALLYKIKQTLDPTLTFGGSCRSGVCGSCAVMVNNKATLACSYIPQDGDYIEPLSYHEPKRDLLVEKSKSLSTLKRAQAWQNEPTPLSQKETQAIEVQTNCILCHSCYAACPVMEVNSDFLGPFALTRAFRYATHDVAHIQTNGIWDCTLCGECTVACPQGIDPKMDIMNLRAKSVQQGFNDPNFANMNFGFIDGL